MGKSLFKQCLKKCIKFELIRNITHQIKSMRESLIPQQRATETLHYPVYVIGLQKGRQIQAKFAQKIMHENDIPQSIKVITKNNKNLCLHFCRWQHFDTVKKQQKTTKKGKFAKITKVGFMKTGCSKKKNYLRKKKHLWRANGFSKDKWCYLYLEMLSYNLTETKLADLKNQSLF